MKRTYIKHLGPGNWWGLYAAPAVMSESTLRLMNREEVTRRFITLAVGEFRDVCFYEKYRELFGLADFVAIINPRP